jgi:hypothetical protein
MSEALEGLVETLRERGGLLAAAVRDGATGAPAPFARTAASGPRAEGRRDRYELLVEAIYEGYLLHYRGAGRIVEPEDADLALLAGDRLYALGLAELAELGDLEAVTELADVISLVAQAQAAADDELAEAVWEAGAAAVGWGASEAHAEAKARARARDPGAADALRAAARQARDGRAPGG